MSLFVLMPLDWSTAESFLKITLLASGGGRKEFEDGPGYDVDEEGKGTG